MWWYDIDMAWELAAGTLLGDMTSGSDITRVLFVKALPELYYFCSM